MARRTQPSRSFYHATTATARAAAQLARRPAPPPQQQLRAHQYRHGRANRHAPLLQQQQQQRLPSSTPPQPPPKRVQLVVEKRLIRGSAVFRPPTEQDIDDLLRLEASRLMQSCLSATVDIPPKPILPPPNARRRRPPSSATSFRTRSASLLAKAHSPLSNAVIQLSDLAALDDYTALALCLRHIQAYRSSVQPPPPAAVCRSPNILSTVRKHVPVHAQQRSLSADIPSHTLPPSPHHFLLSAATNPLIPLPLLNSSRSRSELLPPPNPSSHHRSASLSAPTAHSSSLTSPSVSQLHMHPPSTRRQRRRLHFKHTHNDDDDDTVLPLPLRILTAIEPVDPAAALIDAQLAPTSSYHVSSSTFDLPLFRRRRRTSALAHNDTGFLNRLHRRRSFRTRPETRPSILRRFSSHRDVQPP